MSNSQSRMVCAVCLEDLDQGNAECKIAKTPCGHQFHIQCCLQAVLQNPTCPMCRFEIPNNWLFLERILPIRNLRRYIQTRSHRARYWASVEEKFEEPPLIGPMLPSQQRWYNMDILEETPIRPLPWSPTWIDDRLAEMRIRFQIGAEVVLSESDIIRCENLALRGIFPEWTPVLGWHY